MFQGNSITKYVGFSFLFLGMLVLSSEGFHQEKFLLGCSIAGLCFILADIFDHYIPNIKLKWIKVSFDIIKNYLLFFAVLCIMLLQFLNIKTTDETLIRLNVTTSLVSLGAVIIFIGIKSDHKISASQNRSIDILEKAHLWLAQSQEISDKLIKENDELINDLKEVIGISKLLIEEEKQRLQLDRKRIEEQPKS